MTLRMLLSILLISKQASGQNTLDYVQCDGEAGVCVPFYLCPQGSLIDDGAEIIDIRLRELEECPQNIQVCCPIGEVLAKPIETKFNDSNSGANQSEITNSKHVCGFRNMGGVGFRRLESTDSEADYGEFPWSVVVLKEIFEGETMLKVYQCGGSLINPSVVLSAAHCINGKDPTDLKVRVGEWDTKTQNELFPHVDHDVVKTVIHEEFYKGGLHNDIALIFLKEPAVLTEAVNTICLPSQSFKFDGSRCFASGWGKDDFGKDGKYRAILKKIELPIVPSVTCQNTLRTTRLGRLFNLHDSFVCAGGEPGKDTCQG